MIPNKTKALKEFYDALDATLTKEEFTTAFKEVINFLKRAEEQLDKKIDTKVSSGVSSLEGMKKELEHAISEVRKSNDSTFVSMRQRALEAMTTMFSRLNVQGKIDLMSQEHEAMMSEMDTKIEEIKREEIKFPDLETPEQTRDKLEKLQDDERLDKNAIRGITVSQVAPADPQKNDLWVRIN